MRLTLNRSSLVASVVLFAAACGGSSSPSGDGDGATVGDGDGDGDGSGGTETGDGDGDGDGDIVGPLCSAGTTMLCSGVDDSGICSGVQACALDGMSWGACECAASGSGGAGSGGENSGGNGSGGDETGGASSGGASSGGASSGGASSGGASSGGSGSGGAPIVNHGNEIVADGEGWVDVSSNDVSVQGYYWTDADQAGSSVGDPDTSTEGSACFAGTAAEVNPACGLPGAPDSCFAATWGSILGLNLNESDEAVVGPWDATEEGIDGFSFVLSGETDGGHVRLTAIVAGEEVNYCTPISEGLNVVRFADFKHSCWEPEPGLVDPTQLQALHFHVATDGNDSHAFDLCVDNLTALEPADPSMDIVPYAGWVSGTSNTAGIEGAAFTFADTVGSTIEPANFDEYGSSLCVNGTVEAVNLSCGESDCFALYWGAAVGLNLNQTGPEGEFGPEALAYNAVSNGVDGFSFNLNNGDGALGDSGGATLRLGVRVDGDDTVYCAYIEPGQSSIRFDEIYANCWEPSAHLNPNPDSSAITRIEWQVVSDQFDSYDYSFCIDDIAALEP